MPKQTGDVQSFVLASEGEVKRIVRGMAQRIRAIMSEDFAVVGVRRRGVPLAEELVGTLEDNGASCADFGEITLKRYSDELRVLHETPRMDASDLTVDVTGQDILLVDDVLYTGRTLLKATSYMMAEGARSVRCAVLCRREHGDFPIEADVTGRVLEVGAGKVIDLNIPPYEDALEIVLKTAS